MALDTFVFTITMPADADVRPLLREVSGHMARYLGLPQEEATQARETLDRLVGERLEQVGGGERPIRVRFERPPAADAVIVDVASSAPSGLPGPAEGSNGGPAGDAGQPSRLSWPVRDHG